MISLFRSAGSLWFLCVSLWFLNSFSVVSLRLTTEKPERNHTETEKPRETPEKRNRRPPCYCAFLSAAVHRALPDLLAELVGRQRGCRKRRGKYRPARKRQI
jgi:hypothetical protein